MISLILRALFFMIVGYSVIISINHNKWELGGILFALCLQLGKQTILRSMVLGVGLFGKLSPAQYDNLANLLQSGWLSFAIDLLLIVSIVAFVKKYVFEQTLKETT